MGEEEGEILLEDAQPCATCLAWQWLRAPGGTSRSQQCAWKQQCGCEHPAWLGLTLLDQTDVFPAWKMLLDFTFFFFSWCCSEGKKTKNLSVSDTEKSVAMHGYGFRP